MISLEDYKLDTAFHADHVFHTLPTEETQFSVSVRLRWRTNGSPDKSLVRVLLVQYVSKSPAIQIREP
jgi:hypothetical protein